MTTRPVADDLFVERDGVPYLLGSTCRQCGTTTFPQQQGCPRCTQWDMEPRELPRTGTLWSFTVQAFCPKPPYAGPADFTPYGVGYVDLGGQVLVETRLTENDPDRLRIGSAVKLVLEPLREEPDGTQVLTFAFAPTD
jgi:uncharacterized OB-fold protein